MENFKICYLNIQIDINGAWSKGTCTNLPLFTHFEAIIHDLAGNVCIKLFKHYFRKMILA